MTSSTSTDYPQSTNWSDFERLCRALLSKIYNHEFQRWGRPGQRQNGVDAWARLSNGKSVALQCKGRSKNFGKELKRKDIDEAIKAAETFPHQIDHFIILTTTADDVDLHDYAAELTKDRLAQGLSQISVWGWNTICDHIGNYEAIQRAFYGHWFKNLSVKQWLLRTSVVTILVGLVVTGVLTMGHRQQADSQKRTTSIQELQKYVSLVDVLDGAYAECQRAMEADTFLFTAKLNEECTGPISKHLSDIEKQIQQLTPYLDGDSLSELSDLMQIMKEDYRQAAIAQEMTGFFEDEIVRRMKAACPPRKSPQLPSPGDKQLREMANSAEVAQLQYYFVLRDFIRPGLSSAKSRVLIHARKLMGEASTEDLLKRANALPTFLAERKNYRFTPPNEPFTLSVIKSRATRDIQFHGNSGTADLIEEARWREVFASSLIRSFYGRRKDIDELISCGVFRPNAIDLAEKR